MNKLTSFRKLWLLAIVAVAVLALGLTACNDDDAEADADTDARLQRVEVLAAMNKLDASEFHAIDDDFQVASEIPEFTSSTIKNALLVSSSTEWPEELAELAETLNTTMEDFIAAMEADDLQASKGLATDTHDAYHDLEHDAWPWIGGEEHAEEDGHDNEAEGSPEATEDDDTEKSPEATDDDAEESPEATEDDEGEEESPEATQ